MNAVFFLVRPVEPQAEVLAHADRKRGVEAQQPAEVAHELPIGENHAGVRVAIELVFDAPQHVVRLPAECRVEVVLDLSWAFVVGEKQTE